MIPDYNALLKKCSIDPERLPELELLKKKFKLNLNRYQTVSKNCNSFPVNLIFAIHYREASLSFDGCFYNGEKIIGKGTVTTLWPKGKGPFDSWEQSAISALNERKNTFPTLWTLEKQLYFAECYNGLAYRKTNELSPYIFSGTNLHDETGKYISDGTYLSNAPDKQLGVASILLFLGRA